MSINTFQQLIQDFSEEFNYIPSDEELEHTPERLQRMYGELLNGYAQNPTELLSKRFYSPTDDMVLVKDINFVSLCLHHWLPFMGVCHFGYVPDNNQIIGLSKIPRLVHCFARRFQTQENMTSQIADSFYDIVKPKGCMIVTEASHLCSEIRGVRTKTNMVTSAIRGCFEEQNIRNEFLRLIKNG